MVAHIKTSYRPGLGTWGDTKPRYDAENCKVAVAPIAQVSGNKVINYCDGNLLVADVDWLDEYHRTTLTADGIVDGIGSLFEFEGGTSNQTIDCGTQEHDEFTFIMPFILKTWASFDYLVGNVSSAATNGWAVYTRNNANDITGFFGDGSATNFTGRLTVDDGEWHLLVVRYKNKTLSMRIDDTDATDATSASDIDYTNVNALCVGSFDGASLTGQFASGGFTLHKRYLEDNELPKLDSFFEWAFEHLGKTYLEVSGVGITGTGSLAIESLSVSGTGNQVYNATGSLPVSDLEISGTGNQVYNSTGSFEINSLELSGTGNQIYNATGSLAIDTLSLSGTGTVDTVISGSGSLALLDLELSGTGKQVYNATGDLTIESLVLVGTGTIPSTEDSSVVDELAYTLYAAIWKKLDDN